MKTGGWSPQLPVTSEDIEVFNLALEGFVGSSFIPLTVSKQVVNGINYCFIAKSTPVTLNPTEKLVKVYISAVPADAKPHLTEIKDLVTI
ncbi:MAG: hypothetical protein RSA01_03980 [Clostridium sp.]|uniref:hypothetical protein n=1 Tax=Clostridium sp. TaxID=1506 RepID=UPI002FCBEBF7